MSASLLVLLLVRARSRSEAVFVDTARFVDEARARMGVRRRIAEPSNRTYPGGDHPGVSAVNTASIFGHARYANNATVATRTPIDGHRL